MQPEIIDEIRAAHRRRCATMQIRKSADLALGANLRTWLGWRKTLPEDERKQIATLAADLVECGEALANGKKHDLANSKQYKEFAPFIAMSIRSRAPTDEYEALATKEIEDLAEQLPAWEAFGKDVRGFSMRSLGTIVGEAGDLSNYATHSKLWKRMCMAPLTKDGVTQSGKQWKVTGGLTSDDWVGFGYSGRRRSVMFVIEENLMRAGGEYHRVYLERKETLRARAIAAGQTVAPSAKIPKGRAAEFVSDGQIHAQAKHYMGKRLLRNLWQAWRRAERSVTERSMHGLPAAEIENASEKANVHLCASTRADVPSPDAGEAIHRVHAKAADRLPPHKSKRASGRVPEKANLELPAGEASMGMPARAGEALPPRKSKRAIPRVPEKAKPRLPAGEARRTVPAKAGEHLPPHKSKRAISDVPEKAKARLPAGEARAAVPEKATVPLPPHKHNAVVS